MPERQAPPATWQKVRIPPIERLVLADIASRNGVSETDLLVKLIRVEATRKVHEAAEHAASN